jgi:Xaa-Pro dipeptidase
MYTTNDARSDALRTAQNHANDLFQTVEATGLVRAGITESQLNEEIYDLAQRKYGVTKYWHKRIVRAGTNTLLPYEENPPDLTINQDDILFLDLGPVFEDWEADFGRTFVIGPDPIKKKLQADTAAALPRENNTSKTMRI